MADRDWCARAGLFLNIYIRGRTAHFGDIKRYYPLSGILPGVVYLGLENKAQCQNASGRDASLTVFGRGDKLAACRFSRNQVCGFRVTLPRLPPRSCLACNDEQQKGSRTSLLLYLHLAWALSLKSPSLASPRRVSASQTGYGSSSLYSSPWCSSPATYSPQTLQIHNTGSLTKIRSQETTSMSRRATPYRSHGVQRLALQTSWHPSTTQYHYQRRGCI